MADLDFPAWPFMATGGSLNRTMPVRLNDIVNVKDFGAVGDGVADDQPALDAAYNYAVTATAWLVGTGAEGHGRRMLFLPSGTYRIGTPPWSIGAGVGGNIHILGANRSSTIIKGTNDTGSVVSHGGGYSGIEKISNLTIWNTSVTSGSSGYREPYGNENQLEIVNCCFIGFCACLLSWEQITYDPYNWNNVSYGGRTRNCSFICSAAIGSAVSNYSPPAGSVGVGIGTGSMINCMISGFDKGIAATGYGFAAIGNYITRCNYGISYPDAFTNAGGAKLNGMYMASNVFERCNNGMHLGQNFCSGAYIGANAVIGNVGVADSSPLTLTYSSGTVTATTPAAHNLSIGARALCLDRVDHSSWTPNGTGTETLTVNVTDGTHFTYPLVSTPQAFVSGYWNYPLWGDEMWLGKVQQAVMAANALDARVSGKSVNMIQYAVTRTNLCMAMRGPNGWAGPTTETMQIWGDSLDSGAVHWTYIQCGLAGSGLPQAPVNYIRYVDLAYGANYDGNELMIYDAAATTLWGTVSAGGSTNRYKIRFNGTNWIRVA